MDTKIIYINPIVADVISERNPLVSYASNKKIKYIIDVLIRLNMDIEVISPGIGTNRGVYRKMLSTINCVKLTFLATICLSNRKFGALKIITANILLLIELLRKVKNNCTVIFYNLPWLIPAIVVSKLILRYNLVVEIEEVFYKNEKYGFIMGQMIKGVESTLFFIADEFILSSYGVSKHFGVRNKPYCVAHGSYNVNRSKSDNISVICNGPTKDVEILYSGAIDDTRGIYILLNSMKFLKDVNNAHLTITGPCGSKQVGILQNKMAEINADVSCEMVSYVGVVSESELNLLHRKADIFVSPQKKQNRFSTFSFPSKILEYLSYGKITISSDIDSVITSDISSLISFYHNDSAVGLARALDGVISSDSLLNEESKMKKKHQIHAVLDNLDENFKGCLSKLLREKCNDKQTEELH